MNLTQSHLAHITRIVPESLKLAPPIECGFINTASKWQNIETPFSTEVDIQFLNSTDFMGTHRIAVDGVFFRRNTGEEMNHGVDILNFKSNTIIFKNLAKERLESLLAEIKLAVFFHNELEIY